MFKICYSGRSRIGFNLCSLLRFKEVGRTIGKEGRFEIEKVSYINLKNCCVYILNISAFIYLLLIYFYLLNYRMIRASLGEMTHE